MRFRVLLFAVTCLALAFSATAFADPFDWQTRPILGTDVTYTGDVVVNTGPIPITIPHYSMLGDPLYHVGSPSMTVFAVGQSVATGSGMWVNPGDVYLITGVFLQLTGGSRTTTFQEVYTATDNFVMEAFTGTGDLAIDMGLTA